MDQIRLLSCCACRDLVDRDLAQQYQYFRGRCVSEQQLLSCYGLYIFVVSRDISSKAHRDASKRQNYIESKAPSAGALKAIASVICTDVNGIIKFVSN